MDLTNQFLQLSNEVARLQAEHGAFPPTKWDWLKWAGVLITSSLVAALFTQWVQRRRNRVQFFKMERVDFATIHAEPALHRGKNYNSVRCITYRLKNAAMQDYREVVVHMGFRSGEIIQVTPKF